MDVLTLPARQQHAVYFYQHSDYLAWRVHDFVREGLAMGETVIVVATEEHRRAVRRSFAGSSRVGEPAYLEFDAAEYLAQFCTDGVLNKARFADTVTPFLTQAEGLGRPIRLYGEGVAVLWDRGYREAAIELEEWWNELIDQYRLSTVLCGYNTDMKTADGLVDVLAAHTHVCLGDAIKPS